MQDVQSHSKPSTVKQFVLAIICLRNYRNIYLTFPSLMKFFKNYNELLKKAILKLCSFQYYDRPSSGIFILLLSSLFQLYLISI